MKEPPEFLKQLLQPSESGTYDLTDRVIKNIDALQLEEWPLPAPAFPSAWA